MKRYYNKIKIYLNFTSFRKWKTYVVVTSLQSTVLCRYENVNITSRSLHPWLTAPLPTVQESVYSAAGLNGRGCDEISYPTGVRTSNRPSCSPRYPGSLHLQVRKKEQELVWNRRWITEDLYPRRCSFQGGKVWSRADILEPSAWLHSFII